MATRPHHDDCYALRGAEADDLAALLVAKGYRAERQTSGACRTDDDGGHWHASAVVVTLTPQQARRLAGRA